MSISALARSDGGARAKKGGPTGRPIGGFQILT
jgi:hypothetical protein